MTKVKTEAWTLRKGETNGVAGGLELQIIEFEFSGNDEVLVEPIYGCWEGNMQHAVGREPIDICIARGEDQVVLGNSGVVRILEVGHLVTNCKVGDLCIVFCNANPDKYGYPREIYGYDAPGTMGLLAKRTKMRCNNVIPIPKDTVFSLQQWAIFSLRFITAWANWKVALKCWRSQMEHAVAADEFVIGWGGGVSFAELLLAKYEGFNVAMITSKAERINLIEKSGITAIERSLFPDLYFYPDKYNVDQSYQRSYKNAERVFLQTIEMVTGGLGAAIFIDNIGLSVYRATLKALSRQGVITTSGWKSGMELTSMRALETINRHIHVHTHYATYKEAIDAMVFAEKFSWIPENSQQVIFGWNEIPELTNDYGNDSIVDFYPLFKINAV